MAQTPPSSSSSDEQGAPPCRIAVVTCAVLELEIRHYAQGVPQLVHIEVMEQGLHNEPSRLREQLQAAVNRVEATIACDAIVLGYGLCSRGIEGVTTRRAKLVVPRAHDCITVLLGGKERYADYLAKHPGTYWYSPGWNKHHTPPGKERYEKLLAQYRAQFNEEDAQYLMEQEQHWFTTYQRATYVDLTVGATEADVQYTRDCAAWLHWEFDHVHGDPGLMQRMLRGQWREAEVLVLAPGQIVGMTGDDAIIAAVPGPSPGRGTL